MDHITIIISKMASATDAVGKVNISSLTGLWSDLPLSSPGMVAALATMAQNSVLRFFTQDDGEGGTEWFGDYYLAGNRTDPMPEDWSGTAADLAAIITAFATRGA